MSSPLIISISGVRGIVGESLTPDIATQMSGAFGHHAPPGPILIAEDGRTSGALFHQAASAGLCGVGRDVIDIGISPTPTTEYAVIARKAAGAVILTASHNPIGWNGLKFLGPDGMFVRANELEHLVSTWKTGVLWASAQNVTRPTLWYDSARAHVDGVAAMSVIDIDRIRRRGLSVVVDTICGAACNVAPLLLERLGCKGIYLNGSPTGIFPRSPEPVGDNLGELADVVKKTGADFGCAFDPDGDRLALVADGGRLVSEEITLALAVKQVRLKQPGGPVVINLSTSRMVEDLGIQMGFDVHRSAVGEINVADEMARVGANLGGEGNGGVMLEELHVGRDGFVALALVLDMLADSGTTLSKEINDLPQYSMHKQKISHPDLISDAALDATAGLFADGDRDKRDGVRVEWNDRWVQVRASNTEPIVRVFAEAPTASVARSLVDQVTSHIGTALGLPLSVS